MASAKHARRRGATSRRRHPRQSANARSRVCRRRPAPRSASRRQRSPSRSEKRKSAPEAFYAALRRNERICEKAGASQVERLTGTPGFSALQDGAGAKAFAQATRAETGQAPKPLKVVGASDARYFRARRHRGPRYRAGRRRQQPQPNEFVALEEMVVAALIQLHAAERLLGI